MWYRSASFILDKRLQHDAVPPPPPPTPHETLLLSPPLDSSTMAETLQNPNPNPNNISAYYQTRAAHHGVVTSDWLTQAQAAVGRFPDEVPTENASSDSGKTFSVIDEFDNWRKQPDLAEAVAAIRALASVIRSSEATTMMELEIELKKASDSLKAKVAQSFLIDLINVQLQVNGITTSLHCCRNTSMNKSFKEVLGMQSMVGWHGGGEFWGVTGDGAVMDEKDNDCVILWVTVIVVAFSATSYYLGRYLLPLSWDTTSISLTAGCDLFMRYVTRTSALEYEDFNSAKSRLIERAEKFGEISYKARKIIAMLSQDFIFDGCTILVHGFSRVVLEVLKAAAENRKLFRVLCTEGRPDRTGLRLANELAKLDVPVKLLIDSAVAYSMDEIDMVFVGADGVVESGGIINMMGTYQIALVAHSMNKPVYVAAESYKFARLYPLDQKDMAPALRPIDFGVPIPSKVEVETSARDYTPPQFLTLLFTDLGVLTPSVVSDELIQLYL
ncbi:hypothetical protein TEA_020673 [Camellia sinensis var. sinensis]|uniref:Translation initiation factor eIF2B subunit alpha n=1 Tax=Camellia sinensis var. sinensis TaxID=542762 RepID=A0A4S4CX78_CAMSN|nr:hypothetical protein TEA_020673 [Camellia sinensis var. sinensis]